MKLIIKTFAGLEATLAAELAALGAADIEAGNRVVTCSGDTALLYRANLHLRTGLRVLVPLADFTIRDEQELYDAVRAQEWSRYLTPERTLAVDAVTQHARINHSHFLALKTKDAVADYFRDRTGQRPSVDTQRPDLRIHLHLGSQGECSLSLDSSGDGLHRRGYRLSGGPAPLNEVLAAGLLQLAEYTGEQAFVDPLCGSGTLVTEAALIASQTPPGWNRRFGFERWPDFEAATWQQIRAAAQEQIRPPARPIVGSDISGRALDLARDNARNAGIDRYVRFYKTPFERMQPPPAPGLVVTNPPYELRLQTGSIENLYRALGDAFKQQFTGYTAWVLSGNLAALKQLGLRTSRRLHLFNGPLEVRFHRYDLY